MKDQLFKEIPIFQWRELDGKTLHISVEDFEDHLMVVGREQNTSKFYALHCEKIK